MPRWQVFCAVALRRLPEIIPKKDPIESKVQKIFQAYEDARSRYSEHEMQHARETTPSEDQESEVLLKETAQDRLDKWTNAKAEFKFADYDDRLSKTHYLFMKSRFGTDIKDQWLLPQATFNRELGDQDLLDTARRALKENLNIINGFTIISRIPSSHHSLKYPLKVVDSIGYDGAKIFYLKANLDRPSKEVLDALDCSKNEKLKWLTKGEAEKMVPKHYFKRFKLGLLHEDPVDLGKVMEKAVNYAKTSRKISAQARP